MIKPPSKGTIKFLKYGAPMMIFMLAGSYGLAEFTDIRIKRRDEAMRTLTADEVLKFKRKGKADSIEALYDSMKDEKRDDWENVRGPRIWEEETLKNLPTYKS